MIDSTEVVRIKTPNGTIQLLKLDHGQFRVIEFVGEHLVFDRAELSFRDANALIQRLTNIAWELTPGG